MDISCIQQALKYAGHNQLDHLEGFKELLRFPSISQDTAFQPQLLACVNWLVDEMTRIGLENCKALPTRGNPVVYGDWVHAGDEKPTVLLYAHYDVQPVGDEA